MIRDLATPHDVRCVAENAHWSDFFDFLLLKQGLRTMKDLVTFAKNTHNLNTELTNGTLTCCPKFFIGQPERSLTVIRRTTTCSTFCSAFPG